MADFTFDTSGEVYTLDGPAPGSYLWPDITPFTQGTLTAAARELYERLIAEGWTPEAARDAVAYRNWSPAALARIMGDCEAFGRTWRMTEPDRGFAQGEQGGRDFWWMRQRGALTEPPFPPLTFTLSDDGKVEVR